MFGEQQIQKSFHHFVRVLAFSSSRTGEPDPLIQIPKGDCCLSSHKTDTPNTFPLASILITLSSATVKPYPGHFHRDTAPYPHFRAPCRDRLWGRVKRKSCWRLKSWLDHIAIILEDRTGGAQQQQHKNKRGEHTCAWHPRYKKK